MRRNHGYDARETRRREARQRCQALLTGANHGDEYEGPIALLDLARTLSAEEIAGRVIIVPMMNYPAFRAGNRISPIDGGNLNRAFPGRPNGTVTEKIADYFQRFLGCATC